MKEEDIRPEQLFLQYLSLAAEDADTYFRDVPYYKIPCPACSNKQCSFVFRKSGFDYEECSECGTLFANPRPKPAVFSRYYSDAPSIRFWATHFYKQTEVSRRNLLIKPKALLVKQKIERYIPSLPGDSCIIDIGAGYGVFCEELKRLFWKNPEIIAIEPSQRLQKVCKKKGIHTINKYFEDITKKDVGDKKVIAATIFELLEHLPDPNQFLAHCRSLFENGTLLILTTLNWHGFDLQVLRERSKSIQPPAHINFFTPQSVKLLLERHGFRVCEVNTPGKLDVDIAAKQLSDIQCGFIQKFLTDTDISVKEKFQNILQDANMSSHMMVVAQKVVRIKRPK